MKKEFLKMAGVENEKDFYKLFPTEEAFFGMYPEAKKLVQKAYGGLIQAQQGVEYKGPSIVDYLATKGYQGSKPFRKQLAQEYGVEGYDYSAAKNLELLGKLRENQEILSQHEKSFSPVTVESIEQLHQKNKAGLDRHPSLPGRQEAKKQVDLKRLNALLDIASLPSAQSLGAPLPSLSFKNATTYSNVKKKQQPKPSDPIEEGEYDVQEKPKTKVTESPSLGITDYLNVASHLIPELYTNYVQSIYDSAVEGYDTVSDLASRGIDLAQEYWNRRGPEGWESKADKVKSSGIPSVKNQSALNTNAKSVPKKPSFVMGEFTSSEHYNQGIGKAEQLVHAPTYIDLNDTNLKFGSRNRKEYIDVNSPGFFITTMGGSEYEDKGSKRFGEYGENSIRKYKDNQIQDNATYIGVDDSGKIYLDYGKNLKGKNLKMTDIDFIDNVTGFAKNQNGSYKYGNETDNKKYSKVAHLQLANGQTSPKSLILISSNAPEEGQELTYGKTSGGKAIIATPDLKYKIYVSGSLKDIDNEIQEFKKLHNISYIKYGRLDNGSYKQTLQTKSGKLTKDHFKRYDKLNHTGGTGFYLQKKHGGAVLPKAQWGFIGQTIGQKVLPGLQKVQDYFNQNASNFKPPSEALPGDIALEQQMFPTTTTTTNFKQFWESSQLDVPKYKDIYGQDVYDQTKWLGDPNYNVSTTSTNTSPNYLFGNVGKFFDKNAAGIKTIASLTNMGFALGSTLAAQKEYSDFQKNLERNLRNKIFTNPVMPSVSGSRGDYTQTGAFRPNEYTVNKGMYTSNMPGAVVGTQQFTKFGGPILQFGGGAIQEAIVPAIAEFSPIVSSQPTTAPEVAEKPKSYKHSGANPIVEKTWDEISKQYSGVKFLGIWGDSSHQKRKSDHNSGNALDIGILNTEQGDKIAQQLISEADDKRIKYLIFNRKIWSPEDGWKKYTPTKANGNNPHTSHVHVSFYPYEGTKRKAGESIAVSHNNPGNIHFGEFTSQWGAEKGMYDNKGHVAKFNSIDEGWEALQQLLFGSNYNNLSILEARNKWVTGKPNTITDSSKFIAKELGIDGNVPISKLSPSDKIKLASLFVKYEDNKMYKKMKDLKYFEMGGQVSYNEGEEYDLTEDEIRQILENGGDLEYI